MSPQHTQVCRGFHLRITRQAGRPLSEKCPRLPSCSQHSSHWQNQSMLIPVSEFCFLTRGGGQLCAGPGGWEGTLALPERGGGARAPPASGPSATRSPASMSEAVSHVLELQRVPCPRASGYPELGVGMGAPPAPKRDPGPRKGPAKGTWLPERTSIIRWAECAVLAAGSFRGGTGNQVRMRPGWGLAWGCRVTRRNGDPGWGGLYTSRWLRQDEPYKAEAWWVRAQGQRERHSESSVRSPACLAPDLGHPLHMDTDPHGHTLPAVFSRLWRLPVGLQ